MTVTKDMIIEAGKKILVWRSLYNRLCRKCQQAVFKSITNVKEKDTNKMVEAMKTTLDKGLCDSCKRMMDKAKGDL